MVAQVLAVLSGFGFTLVAARTLTLAEFAAVSWALSWSLHLGVLAGFGSGQSSVIVAARQGPGRVGQVLPRFGVLILSCCAIVVVAWLLVIGPAATGATDQVDLYRSVIPSIAVWIPSVALAGLVGGLMRGLGMFGPAALVSEYLRRTVLILLLVSVGATTDISVGVLLIIGASAELAVVLAASGWLWGRVGQSGVSSTGLEPTHVWLLSLRFVFPAVAAVVVPHAAVWIAAGTSSEAAADLAIAIRISIFLYLPQILGLRVLGPRIAARSREGDLGRIEPTLRGFASMSLLATVVCAAIFGLAGRTILVVAFGEGFESAYAPTLILIAAGVANSATGLSGAVLSHSGNEVFWSRTALGAMIVFLVAAFALPERGAVELALVASGVMIARNLIVASMTIRLTGISAFPSASRGALRSGIHLLR